MIKKIIRSFFDPSFLKFLMVGGCNFFLSMGIMFLLYEQFALGYWLSSVISFTLCSIISFVCNRRFTFQSSAPLPSAAFRFAVVIAVCYFIAFGVAKPLVGYVNVRFYLQYSHEVTDRISMLFAQVIFTGLNFIGQRFWTFNDARSTSHEG
ncbi:GtrA-like protein [anaerobic digester metagenome]